MVANLSACHAHHNNTPLQSKAEVYCTIYFCACLPDDMDRFCQYSRLESRGFNIPDWDSPFSSYIKYWPKEPKQKLSQEREYCSCKLLWIHQYVWDSIVFVCWKYKAGATNFGLRQLYERISGDISRFSKIRRLSYYNKFTLSHYPLLNICNIGYSMSNIILSTHLLASPHIMFMPEQRMRLKWEWKAMLFWWKVRQFMKN